MALIREDFKEYFSFHWFGWDTLSGYDFQFPWYLYIGLIGIPSLIIFGIARTFVRANRSVDEMPKEVFFHWISTLVGIPWFLFFASLLCICIALARPQRLIGVQKTYTEGIDIMLVMDISGSMVQGMDISPNRLEKTKQIASDFVQKRQNDNIGLVVFAGEAIVKAPLTLDKTVLKQLIDDTNPEDAMIQGTSIGDGCAMGVNLLKDSKTPSKIMILLSDGVSEGGTISPENAAEIAKTFDVKIYTIGVGEGSTSLLGGFLEITTDFTQLENIAKITKGKFFHAKSGKMLQNIFDTIDKLEKTKLEESRYRFPADYFQIYLFWAIIFLLFFVLLRSTFMVGMQRD